MKNNSESSNLSDSNNDSSLSNTNFPVNRRRQNNNYFYNNNNNRNCFRDYRSFEKNYSNYEKHKFGNRDLDSRLDHDNYLESNTRGKKNDYYSREEFNNTRNFKDFRELKSTSGNHKNNFNGSFSSVFLSNKEKPRRYYDNFENYSSNSYSKNFDKKEFSKTHASRGNYRKINNYKHDEKVDLEGMNQRESLIWQLNHSKYECMICVNIIRAESATWSCENCYHIFHIVCISKWATTCGNSVDKDGLKMNLRCPACQKEYNMNGNVTTEKDGKELLQYRCFCGKQLNPTVKRGGNIPPHSCDEVCGKSSKNDKCPHLCSLMCHPGPCPICEAIVTRNCHCERTKLTTKCNADERTLVCGERCERNLNCGLHKCENLCHAGQCSICSVEMEQKCFCDRNLPRIVICGSNESKEKVFSCGNICGRILDCGNHKCESVCHAGDCKPCQLAPDQITRCWCGKMPIDEIANGKYHRNSCVDPVPSCGTVCGRLMSSCGHECTEICHGDECGPCRLSRDILCRCGKTVFPAMPCDRDNSACVPVLCNKICNKKLSCGRHRCNDRCCGSEFHLCLNRCGRTLSCKLHQCDRECGHVGPCPSCSNVSFDELHCECGAETILPPIACSQSRPICNRICSRDHSCCHPIRHNCHSEPCCPPCTELVSKSCPGGHRTLDNVPCFRPVATCGLPCGRPLAECEHLCIRVCHQDDCTVGDSKCIQPCTRKRSDCDHSCAVPCHTGDCLDFMVNCSAHVVVTCSCKMRSIQFICYKLQNAISLVKFSNNTESKRDNLDLIISPNSNSVFLPCDNDCKKNARNIKWADAFDISLTVSNLHTFYSESLKSFAKKNIDFIIHIEKTLLDFVKSSKNVIEFKMLTEEKVEFICRYAQCFKMNPKCTSDQSQKTIVNIELNRTNFCTPKPLLSELLRNELPDLFPLKTDYEKSKLPSTSNLAMSFADRIRLSKKE